MRHWLKRVLSGLTALTLLLTAGCSGGSGGDSKPAMGRYVEQELALPEGLAMVLALRAEGDALDLIAYVDRGDGKYVDLTWFRSPDWGKTWEKKDVPVFDEMNAAEMYLTAEYAAWGEDGLLYLHMGNYGSPESEAPEPRFYFSRLEEDGTLTDLPADIPSGAEGEGTRSFRVAKNGDFIIDCYSSLYQFDATTGEIKNDYAPEQNNYRVTDGYALNGDQLAVSDNDRLVFYDLTTMEQTGEVSCQGPAKDLGSNSDFYRLVAADGEGNYCYADSEGLYRAVPESSVLEQVVSGTLSSLGVPSMSRQIFLADGDRFLLVVWSNGVFKLLSYTYNPDVPTLPANELRIWSLLDDPLIRQAIGQFQQERSDVYVSYEVGAPGDGSANWNDAIKTLATELVAGKGPDILVLDYLPVDSYVEKGVLSDISADMKTLIDSGAVLKNMAGAFLREDGTSYAVPAQFWVPLLHGANSAVDSITDLDSMLAWLKAHRDEFNHPLRQVDQSQYIEMFYPYLTGETEADLTAFLKPLGEIWEMEQNRNVEDGLWGDHFFQFGALFWKVGAVGLDIGDLGMFQNLYAAQQTSTDLGDGKTAPLFGQDVYLPRTVLGVSAQSKQQDLARGFIRCALSAPVQDAAVGMGLPVCDASFVKSTQIEEGPGYRPDNVYSTYGTSLTDKDGAQDYITLQVQYPPQEYRDQFAQTIRELNTPVLPDATVLLLLIDGSKDYFDGKVSLEETVKALADKISLYRSEQGN